MEANVLKLTTETEDDINNNFKQPSIHNSYAAGVLFSCFFFAHSSDKISDNFSVSS